jgi:hypothetical protein
VGEVAQTIPVSKCNNKIKIKKSTFFLKSIPLYG